MQPCRRRRSDPRRARPAAIRAFLQRKPGPRDPAVLDRLRAAIRRIEEVGPAWSGEATVVLPLGIGEIDAHLPGGGLPAGTLHEIVTADTGMAGTASAFSAHLASLSGDGPVLWCESARILDAGALHPPGLRRFGLEPERLVFARTGNDAEALWAMEDGLRCGTLAAVVGTLAAVSLTESRRPPARRRDKRGDRVDAAPSRCRARAERRDDPLASRRGRTRRRRDRSLAARLADRDVSLPRRAARHLGCGMAR